MGVWDNGLMRLSHSKRDSKWPRGTRSQYLWAWAELVGASLSATRRYGKKNPGGGVHGEAL